MLIPNSFFDFEKNEPNMLSRYREKFDPNFNSKYNTSVE